MAKNEEHLNNAQFLLLKLDIGLTSREKLKWQDHLLHCATCQDRFSNFGDRFKRQSMERKNPDLDLVADLMRIKQQKLPDDPDAFLEALFQKLMQTDMATRAILSFPSFDEARELPINVPEGLKDKIYAAIKSRLEVLVAALKAELTKIIQDGEKTITCFILEILGLRPAATGGELLDKESILLEYGIPIQHQGGDLQFQVGKPQIKVELYSEEAEDEPYLLVEEAISNQEGIVHFEGIFKGNYRLLLWADANVLETEKKPVVT